MDEKSIYTQGNIYQKDYGSQQYGETQVKPGGSMNMPSAGGTRCPGKEISGLILGIMSLYFSIFSVAFCWFFIYTFIFGSFAIGCGTAAIILNKKVREQATVYTKKTTIGKNMGVAGVIIGPICMVISIIIVVVFGLGFLMNVVNS